MPRRRCKIKSVDEIKSLDSSSVRRLCSSSVPERREEALREVLRRAAQWDMECQDYARKLRVWQPQNVLRCLEGEPRAVGFVPPCREFCVPSFMPDTMLEDELVAVTMCSGSAFPTNDGPGDLEGNQASADVPAVINLDCILEQALVEFQSKSVQVPKDFRSLSGRTNFAVAAAISPAAAVIAAGTPKRRARGGRKWRQPTTLSTTS